MLTGGVIRGVVVGDGMGVSNGVGGAYSAIVETIGTSSLQYREIKLADSRNNALQ